MGQEGRICFIASLLCRRHGQASALTEHHAPRPCREHTESCRVIKKPFHRHRPTLEKITPIATLITVMIDNDVSDALKLIHLPTCAGIDHIKAITALRMSSVPTTISPSLQVVLQ